MFVQKTNKLIGLLIWTLLLTKPTSVATAQTQDTCETKLTEAQQQYNAGHLDEAIVLLDSCLNQNVFNEENKISAYKLLALSYIAKNDVAQAKTAIKRLLELMPNYVPDTVQDPPQFVNLIKLVQQEMGIYPPSDSDGIRLIKIIQNWLSKNWQWFLAAIVSPLFLFYFKKIKHRLSPKTINETVRQSAIDWSAPESKASSGAATGQSKHSRVMGDITRLERTNSPSGFFSDTELSQAQFFSEDSISYSKIEQTLKFYRDHLSKEYEGLSQQANVTFRLWIACVAIGFLILIGGIVTMVWGHLTEGALTAASSILMGFIQRIFQQREDHYRALAMKKNAHLEYGNQWLLAIQTIDSIQDPIKKAARQTKLVQVLTIKLGVLQQP